MKELVLFFREEVRPSDRDSVREIVRSTGFFSEEEIDIAVELVSERLQKGPGSGYHFLFAEDRGRVIGYSCFGRIPGTACSYDLYWIAVHEDRRRLGIGRRLLRKTEETVLRMNGCRIYIETSSRARYEPTRGFYLKCGYGTAAVLDDFYAPGDSKLIYSKTLQGPHNVQDKKDLRLHAAGESEGGCAGTANSS
jgi:GNAT superfamily N-acetyltransferase